jgi:hypothetical protein
MSSLTPLPKAILGMWSLYPLLVPFYLMGKTPIPGREKVEGGVPQLADYYLVALMALVFAAAPFRLRRAVVPVVLVFACFVGYTVFINLAWGTILEDLSLLKNSLFYGYDLLLFVTCLTLYSAFGEEFLKVTVYAVGASVVLQAVLSPLAPGQANSRQALFFNNENQLGYFCILAATMFVLGARQFRIRLCYQLPVYASVVYLTLLSQSRSALLALGVLAVLELLDRPLRLLLVIGGVLGIWFVITLTPPILGKSEERLVVQGGYDTAAARGYDRIANYAEYTLFGAGEGAYHRFRSDLYDSELHSSYGTLLFCYGIVGTVLFTLGLIFTCKSTPRYALYLIPAFVHGFVHQGLRFAFFWAMLGFLCCSALAAAPAPRPAADAPEEDSAGEAEGLAPVM